VTHPAIRDLFQSLGRDPAFQDAVSRLIRDPHARLSLSGLTTTAKALYIVLLWQATERNLVVVVDGNNKADTLTELVDTFFDLLVTSDLPRPQTIPALDVLPAQEKNQHHDYARRLRAVANRIGRVLPPARAHLTRRRRNPAAGSAHTSRKHRLRKA
jgi:transcription-repair coupling factor (superfamily II helicase)